MVNNHLDSSMNRLKEANLPADLKGILPCSTILGGIFSIIYLDYRRLKAFKDDYRRLCLNTAIFYLIIGFLEKFPL